jgi:hypothetical protein
MRERLAGVATANYCELGSLSLTSQVVRFYY